MRVGLEGLIPQWLIAIAVPVEDPGLVPSTDMVAHNCL